MYRSKCATKCSADPGLASEGRAKWDASLIKGFIHPFSLLEWAVSHLRPRLTSTGTKLDTLNNSNSNDQSNKQSNNQQSNKQTKKKANQQTNQQTNKPINQPTNKPTNQPTNQPASQPARCPSHSSRRKTENNNTMTSK